MIFEAGDKIIFMGDSVTDCERAPEGEGLFGAIGKGYVGVVASLLDVHYPQLGLRVINKGISGNQSRDLKARWEQDALSLNPDWVCIMIGVNDVWRQFDLPTHKEKHVPLEEYRAILEDLIVRTLPHVKGMILATPVFMEPNRNDPMRATLDTYGQAVRELAAQYNLVLADTQSAFDRHFAHVHPCSIAWDRIHPNQTGHTLLASCILNAAGFCWQPV